MDLGELVESMAAGSPGRLAEAARAVNAPGRPGAALGVVVASRGYPESTEKGSPVESIPQLLARESLIFHASTWRDSAGVLRVGGGRCFTAVGLGDDRNAAAENAYKAARKIRFDGGWFRRDIGRKFMEARP
jgi:phosphoribosylamine--glycine ligase